MFVQFPVCFQPSNSVHMAFLSDKRTERTTLLLQKSYCDSRSGSCLVRWRVMFTDKVAAVTSSQPPHSSLNDTVVQVKVNVNFGIQSAVMLLPIDRYSVVEFDVIAVVMTLRLPRAASTFRQTSWKIIYCTIETGIVSAMLFICSRMLFITFERCKTIQ